MSSEPIADPQRLCGAADVLLRAIEFGEGINSVFASERARGLDVPTGGPYSLVELVDAMTLIIRLDMVPESLKSRHAAEFLGLLDRLPGPDDRPSHA